MPYELPVDCARSANLFTAYYTLWSFLFFVFSDSVQLHVGTMWSDANSNYVLLYVLRDSNVLQSLGVPREVCQHRLPGK